MNSIGDILRTEREKQGRMIAEIAEELCILHGYVRAIESGETNKLPGLFFYKSFARQYAAILALDEKLILPQIAALAAAEEAASARPDVRVLDPLVERINRLQFPDISLGWSVAGLACVLLVCSGIYTWWSRIPAPATARVAVQMPAPVVAVEPLLAVEPVVAVQEPMIAVQDVPVSGVVLRLSATEKTWLSISSGGRQIFSGFLQPSESKTLTGLDIATMKVGNAAGIDVDWNGKPIGPLGTRGQVLTIRFTSQAFEIVPPKQQL